jgi:hypothetical protein
MTNLLLSNMDAVDTTAVSARLASLFPTSVYPVSNLVFTCTTPPSADCTVSFLFLPPVAAPGGRRRQLASLEQVVDGVTAESDFASGGGFEILAPEACSIAQETSTDTIVLAMDANQVALNTKVDALDANQVALSTKMDALEAKVDANQAAINQILSILAGAFPTPGPSAPTTMRPTSKSPTSSRPSALPTRSPVVPGVGAGLSLGGFHGCVVESGEVFCFGQGNSGQLGNGGVADSPVPVKVTGIGSAVDVCAGLDFSCVLLADGSVQCTGSNGLGQLGNNLATGDATVPAAVPALSSIAKLSCGDQYACAVDIAGVLKCWGTNFRHVLGLLFNPARRDYPDSATATNYAASGLVERVATGMYHTCLVTAAGGVFCSGWNSVGQVGDGTLISRWIHQPVVGLSSGYSMVAVGRQHSCALKAIDGGVKW